MGLRVLGTSDITDAVFTEQGADVLLLARGTPRRIRASACSTTNGW